LGFGESRSPTFRGGAVGAPSSRRREDERGLAIVEFIFIVPLLLALLVGIVDFGFLFNDVISVRQGARDGGRQAAVGKFGSDDQCSLTGFSGHANAKYLFCLTKSRDGLPDGDTRLAVIVGEGGSPQYAIGKPVTICEQYRMRSITGVLPFLNGKVFETRTTFRVEVLNNTGGLGDASEAPLPGSSWSFCTAPAPVS
jgi:TadE-like protein